jgi:hypothetical protein
MLKMHNLPVLFTVQNMYNKLIIRYLGVTKIPSASRIGAFLPLFWGMQNRVVLQSSCKALNWIKVLIINMLNSIYAFGFAIGTMYLCIANDSYYGRFEVRCSTHDYAEPVPDAAGTRGIIGIW